MTETPKPNGTGIQGKHVVPQQPTIDTSDIADSHPDTKLGTLRDAIERAKGRRKAAADGRIPAT